MKKHAQSFPRHEPLAGKSGPLPLLPDDAEPTVDLGALLNGVYDRAGYDLVTRYDQPPIPDLSAEESAWAAGLLAKVAG